MVILFLVFFVLLCYLLFPRGVILLLISLNWWMSHHPKLIIWWICHIQHDVWLLHSCTLRKLKRYFPQNGCICTLVQYVFELQRFGPLLCSFPINIRTNWYSRIYILWFSPVSATDWRLTSVTSQLDLACPKMYQLSIVGNFSSSIFLFVALLNVFLRPIAKISHLGMIATPTVVNIILHCIRRGHLSWTKYF